MAVELLDPTPVELTAVLGADEWQETVCGALAAVERMIRDQLEVATRLLDGMGTAHLAGVHVSGAQMRCAPLRQLVERVLRNADATVGTARGPPLTFAVDEGAEFAAARGAAVLAAARLQPGAVEAAWAAAHDGYEWREMCDALPLPVLVEGKGGKGGKAVEEPLTTLLFDAYSAPGRQETLTFEAADEEQLIRLVEGDSDAPTWLLDVIVPAARRRPSPLAHLFARIRSEPPALPEQRAVKVGLSTVGVLEADVVDDGNGDGGDDDERPRLGPCGVILLLLLLVSSVLAAFPSTLAQADGPSPAATADEATGTASTT